VQWKRPENPGHSKLKPARTSGSDLGRLDLQDFARDRDRPRLHRLRDLALEVDVQEPVLQPCALDHNIVGKLEAALKGPLGDALVAVFSSSLGCFSPRIVSMFSFASIERSASVNPAQPYGLRAS
jgi:hypothetical protein